jgi:hypothetical protein
VAGGAALLVGPTAFALGTFIHPGLDTDPAAQLALVAAHPDAWYATHVLGLVFVVAGIPGVLALVHLARAGALRHVGAALAMMGLVGWGAVVALYGWVGREAALAGDRSEMAALFERVTETPAAAIPTRGLAVGLLAGMACLAVALLRARAVPRWTCVFAPGLALFALGARNAVLAPMRIGTVLAALGLGAIGWRILRDV